MIGTTRQTPTLRADEIATLAPGTLIDVCPVDHGKARLRAVVLSRTVSGCAEGKVTRIRIAIPGGRDLGAIHVGRSRAVEYQSRAHVLPYVVTVRAAR